MSEELDPRWHTISRFQPNEVELDTLLKLLNHVEWQVRFNAARALRFDPDARALDSLLNLFQHEKEPNVRRMVARALGALHEAGVEVPLFADLKNLTAETRHNLALERLKELKVSVSAEHKDYIQLMIPHKLAAACFIEVGFLMAQLTDVAFPEHYAPLDDNELSSVLPVWSNAAVQFVESYPHGMKFRVYRHPTTTA